MTARSTKDTRSSTRVTLYACPCGDRYPMDLHTSIDVSERADLLQRLLDGNLNQGICPGCGVRAVVDARCVLHDPASKRLVLYIPDCERHEETDPLVGLLESLSAAAGGLPEHVVDFGVVHGHANLRPALSAPGHAAVNMDLARLKEALEAEARDVRSREQKIAARTADIEARLVEVDRKMQEVEEFRVALSRQSQEIERRRIEVEEFARQIETRDRTFTVREPDGPLPGRFPAEVVTQARPAAIFEEISSPASTLERSIEQALPKAPASRTAGRPAEYAVSDDDVIEETDLLDEEAEVEDRAPVTAPKPALATARPTRARAASPAAVPRKTGPSPRGLDAEAREALSGRDRRFVRLDGDRVELFAVSGDDSMFRDVGKTSVRFRVHQVEDRSGYTWIVLSLAVRPLSGKAHLFPWLLDYKVRVHRRIVGKLGESCSALVTLVTPDMGREATFKAANRIEGNVKSIAADVERIFLDNPDMQSQDAVDEPYIMGRLLDELKKPFPFHARYVEDHVSHAGLVEALSDLDEWGAQENVRRLVRIYSFPLEGIATIKRRILTRAVSAGLDLPGALPEDAVSMGLADDVPALLMHSLGAFLAICRAGTDLSHEQMTDNWRRLLDAVGRHGVPVSLEVAEMALDFLGVSDLKVPGVEKVAALDATPLPDLQGDVLSRWLFRPSRRAAAAVEILRRGGPQGLAEIAVAMECMAPADILELIPYIMQLDEAGESFFLDGLKSNAPLVRLASAVALGKLRIRTAVVPLINALCERDEPEWKIMAFVLARYGSAATRTVEQFLRNPHGCDERMAFLTGALAQSGCEAQVKEMAAEQDLTLAALARRGWDRRHQVQSELDALLKAETDDPALLFFRDVHTRLLRD